MSADTSYHVHGSPMKLQRLSACGFVIGVTVLLFGLALLAPTLGHSFLDAEFAEPLGAAHSDGRQLQQSAKAARSTRIINFTSGGTALTLVRLVTIIVWCLATLLFASQYKAKVVDAIPVLQAKANTGKDFKYGVFECFSNGSICLHTWCCAAVRVAHTTHVAGVCDFWPACLLWCCCEQLYCCIGVYFRMQIRQKLGMAPDTFKDIVCFIFCHPCSLGQDALEVDAESGATTSCCCSVAVRPPAAVNPGIVIQGQQVYGEVLGPPTTE
jgi:Cys-rich protein (TIGR01571 family)